MTAAAQALRRLALVVAAVCLLGSGGVELTRPVVAATASALAATGSGAVTTLTRSAPSRHGAESAAPSSTLTLRTALAVATSAGAGGETAAPPRDSPLVAPHLVARPVARPPTTAHVAGDAGGPSDRAPPVPAGI